MSVDSSGEFHLILASRRILTSVNSHRCCLAIAKSHSRVCSAILLIRIVESGNRHIAKVDATGIHAIKREDISKSVHISVFD